MILSLPTSRRNGGRDKGNGSQGGLLRRCLVSSDPSFRRGWCRPLIERRASAVILKVNDGDPEHNQQWIQRSYGAFDGWPALFDELRNLQAKWRPRHRETMRSTRSRFPIPRNEAVSPPELSRLWSSRRARGCWRCHTPRVASPRGAWRSTSVRPLMPTKKTVTGGGPGRPIGGPGTFVDSKRGGPQVRSHLPHVNPRSHRVYKVELEALKHI